MMIIVNVNRRNFGSKSTKAASAYSTNPKNLFLMPKENFYKIILGQLKNSPHNQEDFFRKTEQQLGYLQKNFDTFFEKCHQATTPANVNSIHSRGIVQKLRNTIGYHAFLTEDEGTDNLRWGLSLTHSANISGYPTLSCPTSTYWAPPKEELSIEIQQKLEKSMGAYTTKRQYALFSLVHESALQEEDNTYTFVRAGLDNLDNKKEIFLRQKFATLLHFAIEYKEKNKFAILVQTHDTKSMVCVTEQTTSITVNNKELTLPDDFKSFIKSVVDLAGCLDDVLITPIQKILIDYNKSRESILTRDLVEWIEENVKKHYNDLIKDLKNPIANPRQDIQYEGGEEEFDCDEVDVIFTDFI